MNKAKIEKRLNYLTYYAVFMTFLLLGLVFFAFKSSENKQFDEIDVHRINVVEPNGQKALVIANSKRLPGVIMDGKEITSRKGIPGILFYNSQGDESGGLLFETRKINGNQAATGHFAFDRYKQDQIVALKYQETPTGPSSGLSVYDRPTMSMTNQMELQKAANNGDKKAKQKLEHLRNEGKLSALRVFVGKKDKSAFLQLNDTYGNERIRLFVDSTGTPHLEFLDKNGEVTYSLPNE